MIDHSPSKFLAQLILENVCNLSNGEVNLLPVEIQEMTLPSRRQSKSADEFLQIHEESWECSKKKVKGQMQITKLAGNVGQASFEINPTNCDESL